MRFSGASLLGKPGQIRFAEYLKIGNSFFAYFLFRQCAHPTLFWNKQKGGFLDEIWHFWPLEIGGVGDKHPHDSDHAEC